MLSAMSRTRGHGWKPQRASARHLPAQDILTTEPDRPHADGASFSPTLDSSVENPDFPTCQARPPLGALATLEASWDWRPTRLAFQIWRSTRDKVRTDFRPRRGYPHLRGADVETIVSTIFDEITAALARGSRVELRGFGAFTVKRRDARTGRNPRTGEAVPVEEKPVPFFKAGKELRERVNAANPDHPAALPRPAPTRPTT